MPPEQTRSDIGRENDSEASYIARSCFEPLPPGRARKRQAWSPKQQRRPLYQSSLCSVNRKANLFLKKLVRVKIFALRG